MIKLCKRFRKFVRFKRKEIKVSIDLRKLCNIGLHFSGQECEETSKKKRCKYGLHFPGRESKVKKREPREEDRYIRECEYEEVGEE